MHGIYGQIKALNSEASLTSSQQDQEDDQEPRNCFNPDCLYPLGSACAECSLEFEEKEKRKAARSSANRWKWDEEDETVKTSRLVTPTTEEQDCLGPIPSLNTFSVDTFVPDPRNRKSFRHLVDVYPETKPRESFTNLRIGVRKNEHTSSFLADTSSNAIVGGAEGNPQNSSETVIPISEEPDEINELISGISRMLRRDTDKAPTPVQDWLEDIPAPVPESWTESPTNLKRRQERFASPHERPIRPSPSKVRRTNRQNKLCPLCPNPIGNPKDQHLVKCQFAHDERAREEAAKEAALARGQQWG